MKCQRHKPKNYGSPSDIFLEQIGAYCTTSVYRIIIEVIFGLFGQNVFLIGAIIFHVYFNSIYFNVDIVACAFGADLKITSGYRISHTIIPVIFKVLIGPFPLTVTVNCLTEIKIVF